MNCASLPPPLNPLNPLNPMNPPNLTADFHSNGEGKEEAASPQVKKANPASLRPSPLPREGARVVTPSFLWKEVPRRGGGWMGKAVFPKQSLPLEGKVSRRGG